MGNQHQGAACVCMRVINRFPHALRAGALVVLALVGAAVYNTLNREGIRWGPSPDGRTGIPRIFESRLPEISAAEGLKLLHSGKAIFVDARDEKDYRKDHLPGAVNLPMRNWNQAWPQVGPGLPREARLVLYCYGGPCGLSTRMGKRLLELGYEHPIVLRRGWGEWTKAGYPTARRPKGKAD